MLNDEIPRTDYKLEIQIDVRYFHKLSGDVHTWKRVEIYFFGFLQFFLLIFKAFNHILLKKHFAKRQCLKLLFKTGRHPNAGWLSEGVPQYFLIVHYCDEDLLSL